HIRSAVIGGGFGDEPVVEFGRIEIGIFDLDAGVHRLEILDEGVGSNRVGGRVDDDLAFLFGCIDNLGIVGRIAGWDLRLGAERDGQTDGDKGNGNNVSHDNSSTDVRNALLSASAFRPDATPALPRSPSG